MPDSIEPRSPAWRRALAQGWYLWGLSLCYWGNQTRHRSWYRASVEALAQALRSNPGHERALLQRGILYGRELGDYPQAVADLSAALRLHPDWDEVYLQRGLFHRFAGDAAAAQADLERYLELGRDSFWRAEAQRQLDALRTEN